MTGVPVSAQRRGASMEAHTCGEEDGVAESADQQAREGGDRAGWAAPHLDGGGVRGGRGRAGRARRPHGVRLVKHHAVQLRAGDVNAPQRAVRRQRQAAVAVQLARQGARAGHHHAVHPRQPARRLPLPLLHQGGRAHHQGGALLLLQGGRHQAQRHHGLAQAHVVRQDAATRAGRWLGGAARVGFGAGWFRDGCGSGRVQVHPQHTSGGRSWASTTGACRPQPAPRPTCRRGSRCSRGPA